MTGQLALAGFDTGATTRDAVFFAIRPDAGAASRIARLTLCLRDGYGLKARPLAPDRLHVSLYGLGEYTGLPRGIVAAASEAAAAIAVPPFEVTFDRVVSFRGGAGARPLVLCGGEGLDALTAFRRVLDAAMAEAGLGRRAPPNFIAHLTLLYDTRGIDEQAVETIGWTVREFVLLHSLVGQARHVLLGRWPLGRWPLRG